MCRLNKGALRLIALFDAAGFAAYAVGGCVRDAVMGRPVSDFDLAVSALPEQSRKVLEQGGIRCVATGIRHGTVTAVLDGAGYEITTFRADGDYTDHRRPDSVAFVADIRKDLARRDFTVNAMAYHPVRGMIDLFGGKEDIERRVIRAVGDPAQRFEEDALRILRGVRFAATLDFSVEEKTSRAMLVKAPLLREIARERVTDEFLKMLCGAAVSRVLREQGALLPYLCPPLAALDAASAAAVLGQLPQSPAVRLAALCELAGTRELLDWLRLPSRMKREAETLRASAPLPQTEVEIKRLLGSLGASLFFDRCALRSVLDGTPQDQTVSAAQKILERGDAYRLSDLQISGREIEALGFRGKAVGDRLEHLLDLVMQEKLPNDKQTLLTYLQSKKP